MKPWHDGLPEATEFSLFPPAGRVKAWTADKKRTQERLRQAFPELTFSVTDISLGRMPVLIPILGAAGEGSRGICAAPPSPSRLNEIERGLALIEM